MIVGLALAYRFLPCRREPRWRWLSVGSVTAAVVWFAVSLLFSWYIANFGAYNATYGSLGAAVGMMTWMWISMVVILAGAELNAEIERQTARGPEVERRPRLGGDAPAEASAGGIGPRGRAAEGLVKDISDAAHGANRIRLAAPRQFLAQARDMHVDGAIADPGGFAPEGVEQLAAGQDAPLLLHETLEQAELGRTQRDVTLAAPHHHAFPIEAEVAGAEAPRDGFRARSL